MAFYQTALVRLLSCGRRLSESVLMVYHDIQLRQRTSQIREQLRLISQV